MSDTTHDEITELDAAIAEVTVFEDRARVTRRGRIELTAGRREVTLRGLTAALEPGSLRARIEGAPDTRVVGLSASWEAQASPSRDEEAELVTRIEGMERQREELTDRLVIGAGGQHLLDTYSGLARDAVGRHAAAGAEPPDRWGVALDFLSERTAEQGEARRAVEHELRELDRELRARRNELQRLRSPRERQARSVAVALQAGGGGDATLVVEYVVRGAGWRPAYDVRADAESLELAVHATVTQGTGEDWTDVELALSTARPGEAVRIPELTPLLLSGHPRQKLPVTIVSYGTEAAKAAAEPEPPAEQAVAGPAGGAPGGRARAEESETAVRFVVEGRESVPADRRPHRVELMRLPLAAELSHETIPKLAPFVHLKATCSNNAEVPLLAGPVDVFRSSGFIGSGQLEHVAPGEEFSLSLGTEEELKVRRIRDEAADRKPRLLGSKRTLTHAYRVELINRSDGPRIITLVENIPVSQREEIEVELGKATRPDERDDDGFLRWRVALEPGERREVPFAFSISYPKDWNLAGI
jgi:uncharacterized protein (TIGR02231 family)